MKPIHVLVLSPVPLEGAGYRYRVAQYIPALEQHGFHVTASPFFTSDFFAIVYDRGRRARKLWMFLRQAARRLAELATAHRYDLVLIYREALPVGPPIIERTLAALVGRPLVYDFDDAVFLPNASGANKLVSRLKWYDKVPTIISLSEQTIAGNEYLATYARGRSTAVRVIPTCVDTQTFTPRARTAPPNDVPIVGWIGTHSTTKYLRTLVPVLEQVRQRQPYSLYVVGTDGPFDVPGVAVSAPAWSLEREPLDFQACDVGVYPLADDEWSRGKCGFKAIQFMACGVPVVAAAVGVNCEIIEDGVNGFLASTEREWIDKLTRLLSDAALRQRMGEAARRTIEERYSLAVNAPRFVSALRAAVERAGAGTTRVSRWA